MPKKPEKYNKQLMDIIGKIRTQQVCNGRTINHTTTNAHFNPRLAANSNASNGRNTDEAAEASAATSAPTAAPSATTSPAAATATLPPLALANAPHNTTATSGNSIRLTNGHGANRLPRTIYQQPKASINAASEHFRTTFRKAANKRASARARSVNSSQQTGTSQQEPATTKLKNHQALSHCNKDTA